MKECDSLDDAKSRLRGMAEEKLARPLEPEEIDSLENVMEIYDESDANNVWCLSIGIID